MRAPEDNGRGSPGEGFTPATIAWDVRFLRQAAVLLPSAFLLGVLAFLLTHGHEDAGYGTYPFFEQWASGRSLPATPEARFVEQALVFFVPAYVVTLLFILCVALAENGLFGRRQKGVRSLYGRAFGPTFAVLFLAVSPPLVLLGDRMAARDVPGALVTPLLVAVVPFLAAALALVPAAVLAALVALLLKASQA